MKGNLEKQLELVKETAEKHLTTKEVRAKVNKIMGRGMLTPEVYHCPLCNSKISEKKYGEIARKEVIAGESYPLILFIHSLGVTI